MQVSRGTTVQNAVIMLKMAAMMRESPKHKKYISHKLAITEREFYRKVKDLKDLGIRVEVKDNRWFIPTIEEPIKSILTQIMQ